MKLSCPDVFRVHDRRKFDFIVGGCEHNVRRCRIRIVRMHKIDKARFGDTLCEAVYPFRMKLVPAHVRYAQVSRKFQNASSQKSQTAMSPELFALCEEKMHAQADSESRRSGFDFLNERFRQTKLFQIPHTVAERADSRQNEFRGLMDVVGIRSDEHIVAEPSKRILQAAKVIQFVVNYRDHRLTVSQHT